MLYVICYKIIDIYKLLITMGLIRVGGCGIMWDKDAWRFRGSIGSVDL